MSFFDVVKIFFVLILLVGLLYVILFLMKKYLYLGNPKSGKIFNIKILATQMLMPKKYVSLVKIYNKVYLLGVSEQSISLLDKIENLDPDFEKINEEINVNPSFYDYFKKNLIKK